MNVMTKILDQIVSFAKQYIVTPITKMEWIDVVDILLLGAVLYALHCFLRNRRAGRVLMGLTMVIVLSVVVTFFELPALSYIVRLFAASAFFCIVVIFQPEFRDALERLGNSSVLNPFSNRLSRKQFDTAKTVVEETVDAVGKMSESHTGALIVFEGLTKLGDYIQTGKPVDAAISSHLLQNIFYDKAPLHDGALIIRNMRIYAASCVLPSARGKIDFASVGTRHRAAVGLTEVSDALVVVVSEETGIVSVAQDGKILRNVDRKTLYDILMTYIGGNTFLRFKKANLRSEYLERLDRAGTAKPKKEKKIARFNNPEASAAPISFETIPVEDGEELASSASDATGSKGKGISQTKSEPSADTEEDSSKTL